MLAKKARVWFFTAPATLPLLKRTMLKKNMFFPTVLQQLRIATLGSEAFAILMLAKQLARV